MKRDPEHGKEKRKEIIETDLNLRISLIKSINSSGLIYFNTSRLKNIGIFSAKLCSKKSLTLFWAEKWTTR